MRKGMKIWIAGVTAFLMMGSTSFAAKYVVDTAHSTVGFTTTHLMVSKVRGQFDQFSGSAEFDDATGALSNIEATIKTESINTRQAKRDEHLKTGDFFEVAKFPEITFKSTNVEKQGDTKYVVTGDLTIKGVTKSVKLEGELTGVLNDEKLGKRVGFVGEAKINRQDFGVKWNKVLDAGGVAVKDEVTLVIEVELMPPKTT